MKRWMLLTVLAMWALGCKAPPRPSLDPILGRATVPPPKPGEVVTPRVDPYYGVTSAPPAPVTATERLAEPPPRAVPARTIIPPNLRETVRAAVAPRQPAPAAVVVQPAPVIVRPVQTKPCVPCQPVARVQPQPRVYQPVQCQPRVCQPRVCQPTIGQEVIISSTCEIIEPHQPNALVRAWQNVPTLAGEPHLAAPISRGRVDIMSLPPATRVAGEPRPARDRGVRTATHEDQVPTRAAPREIDPADAEPLEVDPTDAAPIEGADQQARRRHQPANLIAAVTSRNPQP